MDDGTVRLQSAGMGREVLINLPDEPRDAPVVFVYHGNGNSAPEFEQRFQTRRIAEEYGVIVVIPSSSGRFSIEWPVRSNEDKTVDAVLFTDVLACLDEHWGIDRRRVYTSGFSAGGFWSTWLALNMSDYIAAVTLFSGGISTGAVSYTSPSWPIPVLASHGGTWDWVLYRFNRASEDLANALVDDDGFAIVCNHGNGHRIHYDVPDFMMPFLLSHTWGEFPSPFAAGLDEGWPSECVIW